jgi:tubulin-folding cofactor B
MILELRDSTGEHIQTFDDNTKTLAFYGVQPNHAFHVVDTNPMTFDFEDVSQVEKYTISEESYDKRDDTFKKFKENMEKTDPNFMKKNENVIDPDF